MKEFTVTEVHELMAQAAAVVIDVREDAELATQHVPGMVHIPMSEIQARLDELPVERDLVIFCRSGNRSGQVADLLTSLGDWGDVANCTGGILECAADVGVAAHPADRRVSLPGTPRSPSEGPGSTRSARHR